LDYANMPLKGFGHREQGKQRTAHCLRIAAYESPPSDDLYRPVGEGGFDDCKQYVNKVSIESVY